MKVQKTIRHLLFLLSIMGVWATYSKGFATIPCMCSNPPDHCTCFIQLGDIGFPVKRIIEVLQEKGYLGELKRQDEFTPDVQNAVIAFQSDQGLECTGWMDDETLNAMLFSMLPDKTSRYEEERWLDICYVPTDGGKRYHTSPKCCAMLNPRMISRLNAERLGISHCKLEGYCSYASELQVVYSSLELRPRPLPDDYYIDEPSPEYLETTLASAGNSTVLRTLLPDGAASYYIGNKKSHIFHFPDCKSVENMNEDNKIFFSTRDDALEETYRPCGKCNP